MKRILLILLCLGLLASCTPQPASDPSPAPDNPSTTPSLAQDEEPTWLSCRIVDGAEEGELLLAELDHPLNDHELNHHGGKSVYRLSLNGIRGKEEVQPDGTILAVDLANNGISIYLDGEPAEPSDLKDGMSVELSFDGAIEESFPGQLGEVYELHAYNIGTPQCPGGSYYDLCGLYLQVAWTCPRPPVGFWTAKNPPWPGASGSSTGCRWSRGPSRSWRSRAISRR